MIYDAHTDGQVCVKDHYNKNIKLPAKQKTLLKEKETIMSDAISSNFDSTLANGDFSSTESDVSTDQGKSCKTTSGAPCNRPEDTDTNTDSSESPATSPTDYAEES
jgi:hypothetical protein